MAQAQIAAILLLPETVDCLRPIADYRLPERLLLPDLRWLAASVQSSRTAHVVESLCVYVLCWVQLLLCNQNVQRAVARHGELRRAGDVPAQRAGVENQHRL